MTILKIALSILPALLLFAGCGHDIPPLGTQSGASKSTTPTPTPTPTPGPFKIPLPPGSPATACTPKASLDGALCASVGDKLTVEQAKGRIAWVNKCFPQYKALMLVAAAMGTYNGQPGYVYPSFDIVDSVTTDPTTNDAVCHSSAMETGVQAPTDASAQCVFHEGYYPVYLCAPCNLSNRGAQTCS